MLKKLLVLSLVLGLAGVANATFSLSLNGSAAPAEVTITVCDYVTIDVSSTDTTIATNYLELVNPGSNGEWAGDMTVLPAAGNLAFTVEMLPTYPGTWQLQNGGTIGFTAGVQFEISFHCKAVGDVVINLYDASWTYPTIDTMTIHQIPVPEPMTIALLGLGGLFLRRRK